MEIIWTSSAKRDYRKNLDYLKENWPISVTKEFIQEVETSKPKYIVLYDHTISILRKPNSDMSVFTWFNSWVVSNYNRVGLVDMIPNQPATYLWGAEIGNYQPQSNFKVYVYERK